MSPTQSVNRAVQRAPQHRIPSWAGYIVYCDSYTPNSAGIGCLYRLCDELNRRGCPAFMTGGVTSASHLNAPIIENELAKVLCAQGYIAVYPETVAGNPLNARTVVRWVLNRPGLLGGDQVYDQSELVFSYSDVFAPYIQNDVAGRLYMPTIDESLFHCESADLASRSLECYYIGKSTWKDGYVDRARAFEITRDAPAKKQLGKLFRAARVLYCFDNSTILIYEALLCGCPVVVIPDGTQTKRDFEQLELGLDGIAWGPEEFCDRPVDVAALRRRYETAKREFNVQLDQLIELTQARHRQAVRRQDTSARVEPENSWARAAAATVYQGAKKILRGGRAIERWQRLLRKACVKRVKGLFDKSLHVDAATIASSDGDLSNRPLECFYLGNNSWQDGFVDRHSALEITPHMPMKQLGPVLCAARMFYCFDAKSTLIEPALRCGCSVTLIDKHGGSKRLSAPQITRSGSNASSGIYPSPQAV